MSHPPVAPAMTKPRRRSSVLRLLQTSLTADDFIAVELSLMAYRFFWLSVLLLRLACALFLLASGRLYWFLAHPYMAYYAALLGPDLTFKFRTFGSLFACVGIAHMYQAALMIGSSIRYRHLVFGPRQHHNTVIQRGHSMMSVLAIVAMARRASDCVWARLFDRRGFFGVESEFFHLRFVVRELFEIVSQTVQVYQSSVLISKTWINNLYVTFIVANCWSTPLLHVAFHNWPAAERMVCLVMDVMLDAGTAIVLPIIIFMPYYQTFNLETYNFEIEPLYDDVWFSNMVLENHQVLALSPLDFVFKLVPHISIYSCIGSIKALVRNHLRHVSAHHTTTTSRHDDTSGDQTTSQTTATPHMTVHKTIGKHQLKGKQKNSHTVAVVDQFTAMDDLHAEEATTPTGAPPQATLPARRSSRLR